MIVGIGIDLIEVERVMEKINKSEGFREKVFSAHEISFCESKANKAENYAARFAAKEAFLKATGLGLGLSHELAEIEVKNNRSGQPMLVLNGSSKEKSSQHNWNKIHVSISHLQSMACAIVII